MGCLFMREYNIYCDESCHLINDGQPVMLLGAVWFPYVKKKEIFDRIKEIKSRYKFKSGFEIKWNKVSKARIDFYTDIINYFFDDDDLHFRVLVIPEKDKLDHEKFNQTHDVFYYKQYFNLIKNILAPECSYRIYLDIKDTRSQDRVDKLHDVLCNNHYDFHKKVIQGIQQVRSHEVQALQLTDLLLGAISYVHRGLEKNEGKLTVIQKIRQRSGYTLKNSTLPKESKFNIFIWRKST